MMDFVCVYSIRYKYMYSTYSNCPQMTNNNQSYKNIYYQLMFLTIEQYTDI